MTGPAHLMPRRGTNYNRRTAVEQAWVSLEERAAARGLPDELAHFADVPTETLHAVARSTRSADPGPPGGIGERFARRLVGMDRCGCATLQEHASAHLGGTAVPEHLPFMTPTPDEEPDST